MIEKVYQFSTSSDERLIERIVDDENLALNHMILPKGTAVPKHPANSHVHLIIVKGIMSVQLGEQQAIEHMAGQIVNVPFMTLMDIQNHHEEHLEFFVVKAPNPREMIKNM